MSYRGREVRDLLERLEGRLSRAVLRGLGGSNALPATRLLAKWQRTCAYCGAQEVPLQVEHILARAKGGTDRLDNLGLACEPCNLAKGAQDIRDFLAHDPERLARILAQAQAPRTDATVVHVTNWERLRRLKASGWPLET